ncbi:CCR4-Not complex component, Not1-domain-containing protein [Kalaharituber pfeilii]|nr:CCR4-Not complex component, Not1-domain-containing protein [Kalaharituber pfeilii]
MEVFHKFFRRLVTGHAPTIFSAISKPPENPSSYRLLVQHVKEIANSPEDSKTKFADCISSSESDAFRDFDLAVFMKHFDLDALEKSILALGFKSCAKLDLRAKGKSQFTKKTYEILTTSFPSLLEILANPAKHPDMPPESLALFLEQYFSEPAPAFFDTSAKLGLSYAARTRYKDSTLPEYIVEVTEPIEKLRQQESLVGIFQSAGPASSSSVEACRKVLRMKWKVELTEDEVADVLCLMATSPKASDWNGEVFVSAILAENIGESFNWNTVIDCLDRPDFVIQQVDGFAAILDALRTAQSKSANKFDISRLWGGRWTNYISQLSVFKAYMTIPPDRFDVTKVQGLQKVLTQEDFASAPSAVKALAESLETQKLISSEAVSTLFHLGTDVTLPPDVREDGYKNIDRAAKFTPELLIFGAFQMPKPWSQNLEHLVLQLFDLFFHGHTSYQLVFWKLWKEQKGFVAQQFITHHSRDPLQLTRILDIVNDIRCLDELLEITQELALGFVLDLAALAARRDYLNLEKWLQEMLVKYGAPFTLQCYRFLKFKADAECAQNREGGALRTVSLSVGPVYTFLQFLEKSNIQPSPEQHQLIVAAQRVTIQAYPRLINMGQGHDAVILANNEESNGFSQQIDQRMQQMFKKLYSQEVQIREVVQFLRGLKDSDEPENQDLFACMVHGLFDEYHCYPSYPLSALATTAVLFGSIIAFKLIDGIPLTVALGMVLDAVKHPADSPMYKFGLQALMNFPSRFSEWRGFCGILVQIPGLHGTDIYRMAEQVLAEPQAQQALPHSEQVNGVGEQSEESPHLANGTAELAPPPPPSLPPFQSLHADPPLHDPSWYEEPAEEVQDKVLFILNNLSASNIEQKHKDLGEQLQEQYHQWFADYLVVQRAKTEPNYQQLYLELLDKLNHKGLMAEVLRETYINVIKILNSEGTMSSSTERNYLKNLATWLGGLTIARDKPIKFKNISFRDLLIEGYDTNRLLVVIPFTCKVLEQAAKSMVFKPPNPWLMAIIKLLAELYQFAELKIQSKFEIEFLCGHLELDLKSIEPSTDIRDRPVKEEEIIPVGHLSDELSGLELERHGRFSPTSMTAKLPNLANQIQVNSALPMLIQHPELRRIMQAALDRAIREIITPVVERSVTIASISTTQLILKDFGTEGNEEKMRKAAHSMVQTAAAGLAQVTCKDPLRMSIANNLRQILVQQGFQEQQIPEPAITMCVNDNIDLCCQIIEKAAQERAIPEIDESLAQAYLQRKRYRESRTAQPFLDPATSRYAVQYLPEPFRLKAGGLTPQQLAVYEDFSRMPRPVVSTENVRVPSSDMLNDYMVMPPVPAEPAAAPLTQPRATQAQTLPPVQPPVPNDQRALLDKINATQDQQEQSIEDIPKDHQMFKQMNALIDIAQNSGNVQVPVRAAQLICNLLFTDTLNLKRLQIEAFVILLQKLCEMSSTTNKEVVTWLMQQDDERMFNVPVTVMLVKRNLLSLSHLDVSLARHIVERKPVSVEFLADLIREMVSAELPIAFRCDFSASLAAVGQLLANDPSHKVAQTLVRELQVSAPFERISEDRHQMRYIFWEWIRLYLHVQTNEKTLAAFILQLNQLRVMGDTASFTAFLRTCVETCIAEYEAVESEGRVRETRVDQGYLSVDAFAKLITTIVKYNAEGDGTLTKVALLRSILSLIVVVFNHYYETTGDAFPQKLFFRLFSTMLYEFKLAATDLEPWFQGILFAFRDCFLVLRPVHFPAFTLCWITIVSHRFFMPQMLSLPQQAGWPEYATILETILEYLGRLLNQAELPMVVRILYRGVLRTLLILHHDFPEFLAQYHFILCEAIPPNCVQLRNLILSAYPQSTSEVPDPFRQNLKVDLLPEMRVSPRIAGDVFKALRDADLQEIVQTACRAASLNREAMKTIIAACETPFRTHNGIEYAVNLPVINSLVLYVGMSAIEAGQEHLIQLQSTPATILLRLGFDLSIEARYYFLSSIANHLREPNSHTGFFSSFLLALFNQSQGDPNELDIRQQITRVLLERLIVHRPHPWGVIITLLDLIKSQKYEFWNLDFVKNSPEVGQWVRALAGHLIRVNPEDAD